MNANEKPTASARIFSLHHLLNELLTCYARVNKNHRRCFVNDVPAHLVIQREHIAPLVGDLFAIISSNPGYIPVHISAMGSGSHVKLFAKEPSFPGYCFPGAMAA
jgi:hypothetical protein